MTELDIALELAERAGQAILAVRKTAKVTMKAGGEPVTEADIAANEIIVEGLKKAFPRDAILSEETVDLGGRHDVDRVWIIDPIDGTKEFIAGTDDFAVQIALAAGGEAVLGVVHQAARHRVFHATKGGGAHVTNLAVRTRDTKPLRVSRNADPDHMRLTISRFHRGKKLSAMMHALAPKEVVPAGGVGIKMALVAKGSVDCYLHPSRAVHEWDTCAPAVIVREAGGMVTDMFGGPIRYNVREPVHKNGIAATNGQCHAALLLKVRSALAAVDYTKIEG